MKFKKSLFLTFCLIFAYQTICPISFDSVKNQVSSTTYNALTKLAEMNPMRPQPYTSATEQIMGTILAGGIISGFSGSFIPLLLDCYWPLPPSVTGMYRYRILRYNSMRAGIDAGLVGALASAYAMGAAYCTDKYLSSINQPSDRSTAKEVTLVGTIALTSAALIYLVYQFGMGEFQAYQDFIATLPSPLINS